MSSKQLSESNEYWTKDKMLSDITGSDAQSIHKIKYCDCTQKYFIAVLLNISVE